MHGAESRPQAQSRSECPLGLSTGAEIRSCAAGLAWVVRVGRRTWGSTGIPHTEALQGNSGAEGHTWVKQSREQQGGMRWTGITHYWHTKEGVCMTQPSRYFSIRQIEYQISRGTLVRLNTLQLSPLQDLCWCRSLIRDQIRVSDKDSGKRWWQLGKKSLSINKKHNTFAWLHASKYLPTSNMSIS